MVLATVCSSGNRCVALLFVTNIILSPLYAHCLVMQHSHIADNVWGSGDLWSSMLWLMKLTGKKKTKTEFCIIILWVMQLRKRYIEKKNQPGLFWQEKDGIMLAENYTVKFCEKNIFSGEKPKLDPYGQNLPINGFFFQFAEKMLAFSVTSWKI